MKKALARLLRRASSLVLKELANTRRDVEATRFLLGRLHAARVRTLTDLTSLREAEFGVYSQWGEDGIIEYLVGRLDIPNCTFVEFGVEDYSEANTRFLLRNRNWRGLILDGNSENIAIVRSAEIHWRHHLDAVNAFVTAENINALIYEAGVEGDIGLLSIDLDGNDYWVWRAIDVIAPRIVVCEYNSVFGDRHAITVPYDPLFVRGRAHPSHLYFGASLPALIELASDKGYRFVGCESNGVNAFFVRTDCAEAVAPLFATASYVRSRVRESRDETGALNFVSGAERSRVIGSCPVHDLRRDRIVPLTELAPL